MKGKEPKIFSINTVLNVKSTLSGPFLLHLGNEQLASVL